MLPEEQEEDKGIIQKLLEHIVKLDWCSMDEIELEQEILSFLALNNNEDWNPEDAADDLEQTLVCGEWLPAEVDDRELFQVVMRQAIFQAFIITVLHKNCVPEPGMSFPIHKGIPSFHPVQSSYDLGNN